MIFFWWSTFVNIYLRIKTIYYDELSLLSREILLILQYYIMICNIRRILSNIYIHFQYLTYTICCVQHTIYLMHSIIFTVSLTIYDESWWVYCTRKALHYIRCTLYTVYTVQCTAYKSGIFSHGMSCRDHMTPESTHLDHMSLTLSPWIQAYTVMPTIT